MKTAEQQYIAILEDCYENGVDVINERTGSICRTILNQRIQFDGNEFPLLTTRKMYWKQAIGEMVGYIRGYTNTEQFHLLGVHTWDANALNPAWAESDIGKAMIEDGHDLGVIYGASANAKIDVNYLGTNLVFCANDVVRTITINKQNSYLQICSQLRKGSTDRGLIWSFWNPELFKFGCLRPCMYSHQFSVLDGTLHLTSTQRSCDLPLGGAFNLVQCWFLLNITAKLTGLKVGTVTWNITNTHIYGNQIPLVPIQLERPMYTPPKLIIKDDFDMDVLMEILDKDNFEEYFELQDYKHHPAIKYPFTA